MTHSPERLQALRDFHLHVQNIFEFPEKQRVAFKKSSAFARSCALRFPDKALVVEHSNGKKMKSTRKLATLLYTDSYNPVYYFRKNRHEDGSALFECFAYHERENIYIFASIRTMDKEDEPSVLVRISAKAEDVIAALPKEFLESFLEYQDYKRKLEISRDHRKAPASSLPMGKEEFFVAPVGLSPVLLDDIASLPPSVIQANTMRTVNYLSRY